MRTSTGTAELNGTNKYFSILIVLSISFNRAHSTTGRIYYLLQWHREKDRETPATDRPNINAQITFFVFARWHQVDPINSQLLSQKSLEEDSLQGIEKESEVSCTVGEDRSTLINPSTNYHSSPGKGSSKDLSRM